MQVYWLVKLALVVAAGFAALAAALKVAARERARRELAYARLARGQSELADHSVVTLRGKVRALVEPISAPLSGRACVAHRSIGRVRNRPLEGRVPDSAELGASGMVRFVLVTRDGDVIVDGDRIEIAQPTLPIIPRKLAREIEFVVEAGMAARQVVDFAFEEAVIEVGMTIAVCGVARVEINPEGGGESGFREAPATVRLVGDDRHPLTIGPA